MSRASYVRSRRKQDTPQEAKLRPALEKIAKKTVTTMSPMVNKIEHAGTGALKGYIKGVESLAQKLKPILNKLPQPSKEHRIPARSKVRMRVPQK